MVCGPCPYLIWRRESCLPARRAHTHCCRERGAASWAPPMFNMAANERGGLSAVLVLPTAGALAASSNVGRRVTSCRFCVAGGGSGKEIRFVAPLLCGGKWSVA